MAGISTKYISTKIGKIVENMLGTSVSVALRNSLMFVGALALLIVITPRYTLFVLVLVPVVLGPLFYFGRKVRARSVFAQDRFAEAVGYAGESLERRLLAIESEANVASLVGDLEMDSPLFAS